MRDEVPFLRDWKARIQKGFDARGDDFSGALCQ